MPSVSVGSFKKDIFWWMDDDLIRNILDVESNILNYFIRFQN